MLDTKAKSICVEDFDVNQKSTVCYCGKQTTCSTCPQNGYVSTTIVTKNVMANIKTIIFTIIPETEVTSFKLEYNDTVSGTFFTTACANCNLGTNDFSSSPLTIGQLKISWGPSLNLGICEIWAYQYQNYVPGSSISYCIPNKSDQSFLPNQYSLNNTFYVIKDTNDPEFQSDSLTKRHTCVSQKYDNNDAGTINNTILPYIIVDLPNYMNIYEILQMGSNKDIQIYIVNPSSDLMSMNCSTISTTIRTSYSNKLEDFKSAGVASTGEVQLIGMNKHVTSITCAETGCQTFGTKRIIFGTDPTKDFFFCGMAIMAACNSTCLTPTLEQLQTCPSNISISQGLLISSDPYQFPTNIQINPCNITTPCNTIKTDVLKCYDCNTCIFPSTCSGNCNTTLSTPTWFTSDLQADGQYVITVKDNQEQLINHQCAIVESMDVASSPVTTQTLISNCTFNIFVNPCPAPSPAQCASTVLQALSTCPTDINIPQGSTSLTDSMIFPDSLSTQCNATVCTTNQKYQLACIDCNTCSYSSSCAGTCSTNYTYPVFTWSNVTQTDGKTKFSITASGLAYNKCKIIATTDLGNQTVNSTCQIKIKFTCDPCNKTVITTTNVPNFTNPIPIGATGQTKSFTAYNDTITECGNPCKNTAYYVLCRNTNDLTAPYISLPGTVTTQVSGSSATYPNYNLTISSTNYQMHGISYTCVISATNLESFNTKNSDQTFEIAFDLCVNSSESCPKDFWNSGTWTKPLSFKVYLDGIVNTAQFIYTNVTDKFALICKKGFCGTLQYSFLNSSNLPVVIPQATVTFSQDYSLEQMQISVSTTDILSVGTYNVKVFAQMNQGSLWTGTPLNYTWSSFNITVVNPCTQASPCNYANILTTTTLMTTMSIYLDYVQLTQPFQPFSDTVSSSCNTTCFKVYSLVFSSNKSAVPSDLAFYSFNGTYNLITAQTQNVAYVGTWNVQIKCNSGNINQYSNAFDIIVIACATQSCIFTKFVALESISFLPQNFDIGIDNVAGSTKFSSFIDTVSQACTTITSICGNPIYQVLYSSNNTSPTFTSFLLGSVNYQIAQTSDISLVGIHEVYIQAKLNLQALNSSWSNIISNSSVYKITVDQCSPLPCNYNKIYYPNSPYTMPTNVEVITDGSITIVQFSGYADDVSKRCSPTTGYVDMCFNKAYVIEKPDGTPLPFPVSSPIFNPVTSIWEFTISTTNFSLADSYPAVIHSSFTTPTILGTLSDNKTYPLTIILEVPNPCILLNCSRNSLIINRIGYLEPSSFMIDVYLKPNLTLFDNFIDTKTKACYQKQGSNLTGYIIPSWQRPVCSPPLYELVDAFSGISMSTTFGPPVQILYVKDTELTQVYKVQVSTNYKSLVGDHIVKLSVKLKSSDLPQYSQNFTITVYDSCNPYDCSITKFTPTGLKPQNLLINIGDGYLPSNQGPWLNSVNLTCYSGTFICNDLKFELLLQNGDPVPFDYFVLNNNGGVQVFIIINNENQKGETFDVHLIGYGFDGYNYYGINGTSDTFQVIVGQTESLNQYQAQTLTKPIFTQWPQNITYILGQNETLQLAAVAYSEYGIKDLEVHLNNAFFLFTYEILGTDRVIFKINLNNKLPIGTFKIEVAATDINNFIVTKFFTLTIQQILDKPKQYLQYNQSSIPLAAEIQSINMTGFMTIKFNRRVIPLNNLSQISESEFHMSFTQNSDEEDQTQEFKYKVLSMTPDNIFVQLIFFTPIEVTQGIIPDIVQVQMLKNMFMNEDFDGLYANWQKGDPLFNHTTDLVAIRNQLNYGSINNLTLYYPLEKDVPKQLSNNQANLLLTNVKYLGSILQIVMWVPFTLHVFGIGQMEYTWIIFTNLQIISILSQFDVKLPQNLISITQSYADLSNTNILPIEQLYKWYRLQASDSENPNINMWGQKTNDFSGNISSYYAGRDDDRILQTFIDSKFDNQGYTDLVIQTSAQMLLLLVIMLFAKIFVAVFEYSFLNFLPQQFQFVFNYLKGRIFWCLLLRMLIQQYVCVTLSALMNLKYKNLTDTMEHMVNRIFSYFTLTFYSIGFILFIVLFLFKNYWYLKQNEFFQKFGTLILSIELEIKLAIPLVAVGLFCKFLLILISVFLPYVNLQIAGALYVLEIYTIYIISIKPMNHSERNYIEYFNEILLIFILILLSTLTEYVPDSMFRYEIGWVIIYIFYFQLFVNLLFLVLDLINSVKKIFKILRYKIYMQKKRVENEKHIQVIDLLDKNKLNVQTYKRRNPKLIEQLDKIVEESSEFEKSSVSAQKEIQLDKPNYKSISERKREFIEMMKQPYTPIQKTNFQNDAFLKIDFTKDWLNPLEKRQYNNDWPITPKEGEILLIDNFTLGQDDINDWAYQKSINESRASDWNALPVGYVDPIQQFLQLSIHLSSEQSEIPYQQSKYIEQVISNSNQNSILDESVLINSDARLNNNQSNESFDWV